MIIDGKLYPVDLSTINSIRYFLYNNFYNNDESIYNLKSIISKYIECLSIDYNYNDYEFIIKIKKTAMRKNSGFNNEPTFYYSRISEIFKEFIGNYENSIKEYLRIQYSSKYDSDYITNIFNRIINDSNILANLCYVSCLGDNILVIKL